MSDIQLIGVIPMRAAVAREVALPSEPAAEEASASGEYLKTLPRATLPKEIVAAITELIMTRVWKPGDRIPPEKELAARFGVGRSTVREAIKSLVILGVIEARPGDGSYIREGTSDLLSGAFQWGLMITEQNLGDLVDMRILIEVECAGRAAAAEDPDVGATLLQLVEQMKEARNQPQLFMKLDNQFHEMIAAAAHNSLYLSLSKTIQSLVGVWYAQTYQLERTKAATLDEHLAIATATQAHDVQAAREAMRQHILRAGARLHKIVDRSK
jgi:GntR family transcriptional repressor for pyruvate dehydrogenase complex